MAHIIGASFTIRYGYSWIVVHNRRQSAYYRDSKVIAQDAYMTDAIAEN